MQYKVLKKSRFQLPQALVRRSLLILDDRLTIDVPENGHVYRVKAGEALKSIDRFPRHIKQILELFDQIKGHPRAIVAIGGGSVGDFAGFVASVLKRGVEFHQVPTTWLAAIDSAHGGKTALNVGLTKNQIGSFYPAQSCILFRDLLLSQPEALISQSYFELVKIGIINSPDLAAEILSAEVITPPKLYSWLDMAIPAKMEVVSRDPQEKKGERQKLNLGHTLGHVIEKNNRMAHGWAVGHGILFSARWSLHRGYLSKTQFSKIENVLGKCQLPAIKRLPSAAEFKQLVLGDKKRVGAKIRFVFIHRIGETQIKQVSPDEIYREWMRQLGAS